MTIRDPRSESASTAPTGRKGSSRPRTGTQLLERGGIDQVDLHVLPRLLGDGTRLYDVAGQSTRKLPNLGRR
jgi:hypothetical protein